jgi:ubiquinone/menaquinone biosynthesis C-methylase UbiE
MEETIKHSQFADLYDVYVPVAFDIPFFLQEAWETGGKILELMAGTGRVSIPLIEAGIDLTCVDYSQPMLAKLSEKLPLRGHKTRLVCQDVRNLEIYDEFDLAFIAFNSFAELTRPSDQIAVLQRVHLHLSKNGKFICTLHNPVKRLKNVDGQLRLWGNYPLQDRPGRLLLWGMETLDKENAMVNGLQFFEVYDENGIMSSKRILETKFAIIEKDEFEAMAESAGFIVMSLFGDYSYSKFVRDSSPYMIWVLLRP